MTTTLGNIVNNVLLNLNADANTTMFSLMGGADSTTQTLTVLQAIIKYFNDGCSDLARNAFPLRTVGTYTAFPINSTNVTLDSASLVTSDGSVLWRPLNVIWNGLPLQTCSRLRFELQFPNYLGDPTGATYSGFGITTGVPKYWFVDGFNSVTLFPAPAAAANLVVSGVAVPPLVASGANTALVLTQYPDHIYKTIEAYICSMLTLKRVDDGSMAERMALWAQRYMDDKIRLFNVLWEDDPAMAKELFPQMFIWRGREYNR